MSDLVDRLLSRAYAFKAPDPLLEEAAKHVQLLRARVAELEAGMYFFSKAIPIFLNPDEPDAEEQD